MLVVYNIKNVTIASIFYLKWTYIWIKDKTLCLMSIIKALKLWAGIFSALVFIVLTTINPELNTLSMFFMIAVAYLLFYIRYEKVIYKLGITSSKLSIIFSVMELLVMFNIGWLLAQIFSESVSHTIFNSLGIAQNTSQGQLNYGASFTHLLIPLFIPVFTCKFYTRKSFIISSIIAGASLVICLIFTIFWSDIFIRIVYVNALSMAMLFYKKKDADKWAIINIDRKNYLITHANFLNKKCIYLEQAVGKNNFVYQEKYVRKFMDIFKHNNNINPKWNEVNNYLISNYSAKEKRRINARAKLPYPETGIVKTTIYLLTTSYVLTALAFIIRFYFLNLYISLFMIMGISTLLVSSLWCLLIFLISHKSMKNHVLSDYHVRIDESKTTIYVLYGFNFVVWILNVFLIVQSTLPAHLLPSFI